MSYNPETEGQIRGEIGSEPQGFVDDIQAFRARMKEQERREKEKETSSQSARDTKLDIKAVSRADSSSSWRSGVPSAQSIEASLDINRADDVKATPVLDNSLGRTLLSSDPIQDIDIFFAPGGLDLSKPFESSSAFNKFLSQHVAMSSNEDPTQQGPARKADGSRFARFFTEDEPETAAPQNIPGKPLSLDQLFQATALPPPPSGRMPSEAEILESLKANKPPTPAKPAENIEQSEDAFGFSKIMAALSKVRIIDKPDLDTLPDGALH